jgi:putative ABC transport system substrate-binding protein
MMRRREFIAGLGGAAAWPVVGRAQQATAPVVGFLHVDAFEPRREHASAFRRGLEELGYFEGQNLTIEYRWGSQDYGRLPGLAADLVKRRVSVIAAVPIPAVVAAKAITNTIPIVVFTATDPVTAGFAASLNHPGGNLTGVTLLSVEIHSKRLEVLRELAPSASLVAVLINQTNPMVSDAEAAEMQKAARILGVRLLIVQATNPSEIEAAFATIIYEGAGALLVSSDSLFTTQTERIIALAARHSVPTMYQYRESPLLGGLLSYGPNLLDQYRQMGVYVGRILKGEKPADLPVQNPTKFTFIVNLKTAKALGLTIPPGVLAIADEVIE